MIEWAMIKWRGGGLAYRTGQGLSGTDSELELWEELAAEIARLREQLAAADIKLLDAGHDLRKRDAAIASLTTRAETAEARVAELEAENAAMHESDERCEGCNRVATKYDSEGVPLCLPCWQACIDESYDEDEPTTPDAATPQETNDEPA